MRLSRHRMRLDDFSTHALHARIFSVRAPSGACVCVRASILRLDDFSTHALHALIFSVRAPSGACVCIRASASASVLLRLRLRPCFCVSVRPSVCPSVRLQVGPCGPCVCGSGTNIYNYVTVHAIGKIDFEI